LLHRDAFAVAACDVAGEVQVGDHRIVIGRVFDIRMSVTPRRSAWRALP
jgi:hypothetical protein